MATQKSLPQTSSRHRKRRKLPPGVVVKNGKWYVRVRYRDGAVRRAAWRECAKNATDASEVRRALKLELAQHGSAALRTAQETFGALADYYTAEYLIPAVYVDGRKVAGRRKLSTPQSQLRRLRQLIGNHTRLRAIDYEFLRRLRVTFLALPTRPTKREPHGHQRSIVDVDRHFQLLRHMLRVARRRNPALKDPFAAAERPLITPADEARRRRVMSYEEEDALLSLCVEPRAHLRIVIIGLVDSLMRASEFFLLRVGDLELNLQRVDVQQINTKTLRARAAPMSRRFARELEQWIADHNLEPGDRLFSFRSVKRSFATLSARAGVRDLRLKDLRRTGATRLLRLGVPIEEISQILGHTTLAMTYEYIGVDRDTTARAVERLDANHAQRLSLEGLEREH